MLRQSQVLVMFLRMTCGNSLFEQFQDFDGFEKGTLADLQKVTRLEFAGRFGGSVVHLHQFLLQASAARVLVLKCRVDQSHRSSRQSGITDWPVFLQPT